eukprot:4589958-Pleurochrysis_carterae.AAC.4
MGFPGSILLQASGRPGTVADGAALSCPSTARNTANAVVLGAAERTARLHFKPFDARTSKRAAV